MDRDTVEALKVILPWIIKLGLLGGVIWFANTPVFNWIDTFFYGSPEAARRAQRELDQNAAEIRNIQESNIFNQVSSYMENGTGYRSDYKGQSTMAETAKKILLGIQFFIGLYLIIKFL